MLFVKRYLTRFFFNNKFINLFCACFLLLFFSILTGCYDNTLKVWNTEGDLLVTIPSHTAPVKCVTWLNNGERSSLVNSYSNQSFLALNLFAWGLKGKKTPRSLPMYHSFINLQCN